MLLYIYLERISKINYQMSGFRFGGRLAFDVVGGFGIGVFGERPAE